MNRIKVCCNDYLRLVLVPGLPNGVALEQTDKAGFETLQACCWVGIMSYQVGEHTVLCSMCTCACMLCTCMYVYM